MKTLCSWCGGAIVGGAPNENGLVSHDMCGTCAARMETDLWIEQVRPSFVKAPVDVLRALAGEPSSGADHAKEALESAAKVELDARRRDKALRAGRRIGKTMAVTELLEAALEGMKK